MSKIVFPAVPVLARPTRGFISEFRNRLREAATVLQRNPNSKAGLVAQISAFLGYVGGYGLVTSGAAITGVAPTGVYATTVTITTTAGVITAIVLS